MEKTKDSTQSLNSGFGNYRCSCSISFAFLAAKFILKFKKKFKFYQCLRICMKNPERGKIQSIRLGPLHVDGEGKYLSFVMKLGSKREQSGNCVVCSPFFSSLMFVLYQPREREAIENESNWRKILRVSSLFFLFI